MAISKHNPQGEKRFIIKAEVKELGANMNISEALPLTSYGRKEPQGWWRERSGGNNGNRDVGDPHPQEKVV